MGALTLGIALPARAINPPDSTPTIQKFNIYRNLLETGDRLLLIYANIPYATAPTDPIWQTYIWRLVKSDNVTEFGTTLSYSFNDNGYGYNLTSMYFSAAQSGNFTWNGAHIVKLSGNPAAFATPPEYNFTLATGDYTTLSDPADVKAELAARILTIAADLDTRWGLGTTYSLLNETESGTVLSIYGEAFFRGAIYGLQGICPQVFAYVINDLSLTPRTWTTTYITTLQNQWQGTWVDTAKNAADALFGTDFSLFWIIITMIAFFVIMILNIVVSQDAWIGIMDGCVVLIIAARLGFFGLGFLGLLAAIAWIYDSSRIWGVFK